MLLHHERSRHLEDWELIQEQNITLGMTRETYLNCHSIHSLQSDGFARLIRCRNGELEREVDRGVEEL